MEPVLPISIVISLISGAISATLTLGKRFDLMEKTAGSRMDKIAARVDSIEIRLAKEYVDKEDLANILERLDNRMDRMDYKLDQILIGYNKPNSIH